MNGMDIHLSDRPGHPFIALGLIDDAEAERKERGGKVWAPLLVSLSVHLGIGWWLVTTAEDSTIDPRPADDKIVLRLVPPRSAGVGSVCCSTCCRSGRAGDCRDCSGQAGRTTCPSSFSFSFFSFFPFF